MPDSAPIAFEAALAEIESIVAALERGGPDLNQALASYGRGVTLLTACQAILDNADRTVALLTGVDATGQPLTTPFDGAATLATAAPVASAPPSVAETVTPPDPPAPAPAPAGPIRTAIPEAPF